LSTLQGHASGVWGVSLSADGQLLASGSQDGTVRLWEASTGRLLATLEGHSSGVGGVALSADGRLLASGGLDRTIRLWEAPVAGLEGDEPSAGRTADSGHSAAASPTGAAPASAAEFAGQKADSGDATAEPPGGGRLLATLQWHTRTIFGIAISAAR